MGSCPESACCQEAALHTTGHQGMHPTCPSGGVPHISPIRRGSSQAPWVAALKALLAEDTDFGTALVEGWSLFLEMCAEAQQVAARWIGDSGAVAGDIIIPLGRNNPPPEQLFHQGAESRWMPEPDAMELPDAAALHSL
eukprot:scaffold165590_cov15-Tisochrysis_lutea.AAC.1